MHLGLNGWPPVASHMACLVLGVALAHLARGAGTPPARIPKRGIVLSLPAPERTTPVERPLRVLVLERDAAGGLCRLTEEPVERLAGDGWTLVLPLSAAAAVPRVLKAARGGALQLAAGDRQGTPACGKGPKVTYGMP